MKMKRAKVLMVAVLILVLGLIGFSREQTNSGETADRFGEAVTLNNIGGV